MTSRPFAFHGDAAAAVPKRGPSRWLEIGLDRAVRGFLALWLFAALLIVLSFVSPPRDHLRAADWQLDAGAVSGFQVGLPRMVRGGPEPVWVVRLDNRRFTALAAVCRYQHCVLRWSAQQGVFVCPCHQGTWNLEGRILPGPAGGPMRAFFVNVKADRVRVHLRRAAEVEP